MGKDSANSLGASWEFAQLNCPSTRKLGNTRQEAGYFCITFETGIACAMGSSTSTAMPGLAS